MPQLISGVIELEGIVETLRIKKNREKDEAITERKERGKAAGAEGWIVKPFKGDGVLDTFRKLAS